MRLQAPGVEKMERRNSLDRVDRRWFYALCGFCLGILAPLGWMLLRLILFWQPGGGFWNQIAADVVRTNESIALYIYMGGGTALVLGIFGYLIGQASQQIHSRAKRLDELNRTVVQQKENFERRFQELNSSLKNFHAINTYIQKSVDQREVLCLAADGLHDILEYDRVNILMVNRERNCLEFLASRGTGNDDVSGIVIPLDHRAGALLKTVSENRLFLIDDITRMPEEFHLKTPFDAINQLRSKSFILCPIVVKDEVVGLFGVDNKLKRKALDDTDVDTVKLFAVQVSSALTKINLLDAIGTLTSELTHTFQELLKYREEHGRLDSSLKRATSSTTEAIEDISGAAGVVREAVDSTRSAAGEISVSIEQVSQNLNQLSEFMEKSISAMTQISSTIKSVQENGVRSHAMSETVRKEAEMGAAGVANVLQGLTGISASVDGTFGAISRLSEKGEEIGGISEVINEITQKTNLLALNAAIIAAQAGEHGRSFAVVADEVRNLSQEAAKSTGAIARIISEIQEYTLESVGHIGKTRELVMGEVSLGAELEKALRQILDSASLAMGMAHDIRKATQEVSKSAEFVTQSIEKLGEMSSQITLASREQAQGTRSIVRSIEEVKAMAEDVVLATDKQKQNTSDIESGVNLVSQMVKRIFAEMEDRQKGSREVLERLERLRKIGIEAE
jgi:methyl-accepting chemotaxis protein